MNLIRVCLAWTIRLIVHTFFRNVEIHGREKIPPEGPLVFASNHPNMVLDPFMVILANRRHVHFMGKSTLFEIPFLAILLKIFGVIPVYRRSDDPEQTHKNQEAFGACYQVLEAGGVIGIFPEGVSERGARLRPLKTGTARIVLEAESRNNFSLGVGIVPVGLNFQQGHLFRSDVLVLIGDAIGVSEYRETYAHDSHGAARTLTNSIEERLESITRNIREQQDAEFIDVLERIYNEGYLDLDPDRPHPDLKHKFEVDQGIRDAYSYFLEQQPDEISGARRMLEDYVALVERTGISDRAVGGYEGPGQLFGETVRALPLALLGAIPWLYGFLTNYIPYRLIGTVSQRLSTDVVEIATNKIAAGLILYPAYYLFLTLCSGYFMGPMVAVLSLISFPVAGFFTIALTDRLRRLWDLTRAAALFMTRRDMGLRLKVEREKILQELRRLTDLYQSRVAISEAEQHAP